MSTRIQSSQIGRKPHCRPLSFWHSGSSSFPKTELILSQTNPLDDVARLRIGIAVFGHSQLLVSTIILRSLLPIRQRTQRSASVYFQFSTFTTQCIHDHRAQKCWPKNFRRATTAMRTTRFDLGMGNALLLAQESQLHVEQAQSLGHQRKPPRAKRPADRDALNQRCQ